MRRVQIILLIVGAMSLTVGVLLVMPPRTSVPPFHDTVLEDAVYIGANTCFTCHSDQHHNWPLALPPQAIQSPDLEPEAILTTGEAVRTIEVSSMQRPYTLEDASSSIGRMHRQRYIIKTEDGYIVLPEQWDLASGSWLGDCESCHNDSHAAGNLDETACLSCHPSDTESEMMDSNDDTNQVQPADDNLLTAGSLSCGYCHSYSKPSLAFVNQSRKVYAI